MDRGLRLSVGSVSMLAFRWVLEVDSFSFFSSDNNVNIFFKIADALGLGYTDD